MFLIENVLRKQIQCAVQKVVFWYKHVLRKVSIEHQSRFDSWNNDNNFWNFEIQTLKTNNSEIRQTYTFFENHEKISNGDCLSLYKIIGSIYDKRLHIL